MHTTHKPHAIPGDDGEVEVVVEEEDGAEGEEGVRVVEGGINDVSPHNNCRHIAQACKGPHLSKKSYTP